MSLIAEQGPWFRHRSIAQRWLRRWGLTAFFAALALLGAGESMRLILQASSSQARNSGWYLLVVSGLIAMGAFVRPDSEPETLPTPVGVDQGAEPDTEAPAGADDDLEQKSYAREAVVLFVAAFTFAWALPWIGFAVANGLFVAAYLYWIDHRRWYVAVGIAVIVDICLVVGITSLNVLLPSGVFGLGI